MNDTINELKENFIRIKNMGWIKSINNDYSGSGLTFEQLLGKEEDELPIPDYKGIEIKTKINFSKFSTTLFCLTPTTKYINPMETLVNEYGYSTSKVLNKKVLMGEIYSTKLTRIGKDYLFKIIIDETEEKIKIKILNNNLENMNETIYWDFDDVKKTLIRKLKTLAVVKTERRMIENNVYYRYTKMDIYELKSFEVFIELINKGVISVLFCINRFKSGKRIGQIHDHGTAFRIYEKDLLMLYKNKYTFY